jgi:MFS family permease
LDKIEQTAGEKQSLSIWHRIRHSRLLSLAGIIGPVVFLAILLALDVIQWQALLFLPTISDLVHGEMGWLQTVSFILIGVVLFVFVLKLVSISGKKFSVLTGSSSFGITSIGFLAIAAFPSEIGGLGQTIQGLIHNSIAGVISATFIFGCIAFAHHFRKDPHWKSYWIYTALTVLLCLTFAISWAVAPESELKAISERLLLISGFIWMLVISVKLIRSHGKQQPVPVPVRVDDDEIY